METKRNAFSIIINIGMFNAIDFIKLIIIGLIVISTVLYPVIVLIWEQTTIINIMNQMKNLFRRWAIYLHLTQISTYSM